MPNHVTNILFISGKDAEKILPQLKGEDPDQEFDFNKIISMPKELHITSGSNEFEANELISKLLGREVKATHHDAYTKEDRKEIGRKFKKYMKEHIEDLFDVKHKDTIEAIKNIVKYGYPSWYGWSVDHWGTKWNAYDIVKQDDGTHIQFQTAWATPEPVINALSKMFPENTFHMDYADEDIGSNCGKYAYKNGELIEGWMPDSGSEEARQFACEVHGYDYEEEFAEEEED